MLKTKIAALAALLLVPGLVSAAALDVFTSPRGGEVYVAGQTQQVRIAKGVFKSNVLVELSTDGGTTYTTVNTIPATLKTSPKEFLLSFVVPATPTPRAMLRASTNNKGKVTAIVSQPFIITTNDLSAGVTVADNSVDMFKLADGSVTTPKLADAAVTGAKLAVKSVTAEKHNSGNSSSGFVLTSDGISGAQYQPLPAITNSSIGAAAGIAYSKLSLANSIVTGDIKDGTIIDADINTIAGIQYSKLSLADSITDSDISATAGIIYSKLNLSNSVTANDLTDGAVTDIKVSPTAAIAYSKLNLANSIVTADLTDGSVTPAKINTTGATNGQVLTYNGTSLVFATPATGGGGLTLPFTSSTGNAATLFDLTNTADAAAGSFAINNAASTANALVGKSNGAGAGVLGISALGAAVRGTKAGTDTGSAGQFDNTNAANAADLVSVANMGSGAALHSVASGTGTAALLEVTNLAGTQPAATVINQGMGAGLSVSLNRATNIAAAISVNNLGAGEGVLATTNGGDALVGFANTPTSLGLYAANNTAGVAATIETAYQNGAALQAINYQTQGIGQFTISFGNQGYGLYAYCGVTSANATTQTNTAAHFDNRNPANPRNTVEINSVGNVGPNLSIANTATGQGATAVSIATTVGMGGTALKVTNGALAFGSTAAYAGGVVDNAYLVVTAAGNLALPVVAPIANGATTWVVNNSGAVVTVTNSTSGAVNIAAGNAKQFVFLSAVSAANWIPVQ